MWTVEYASKLFCPYQFNNQFSLLPQNFKLKCVGQNRLSSKETKKSIWTGRNSLQVHKDWARSWGRPNLSSGTVFEFHGWCWTTVFVISLKKHVVSHNSLKASLTKSLPVSHQSKRRRMPTQTLSSSPWKMTTVLLWNTGERKCPSLWSPQSRLYPSTTCPVFPLSFLNLHSVLELCSPSYFSTLKTNKKNHPESPLTKVKTTRGSNPVWSSTTVKYKILFLGSGTPWMLFVLDFMCAWYLCRILQVQGIRGLGCFNITNKTVRNKQYKLLSFATHPELTPSFSTNKLIIYIVCIV